MAERPQDVVVVGGGIVGCAVAYELAREGVSVLVVDRDEPGREASWAGAGILTPIHPWDYPEPLLDLCGRALPHYAPLARTLREETGIDVEYLACGLLEPILSDADEAEVGRQEAWRGARGLPSRRLSAREAAALEPALAPATRGALFLPDACQVRNPRVPRALAAAAARRGARFRAGFPVTDLAFEGARVTGVRSGGELLPARTVVLASGAWTALLPLAGARGLDVHPIRGQMVLLRSSPGRLRHMLLSDAEYLVPRSDGRVLVGSTVENAGFEKKTTAAAVGRLLSRAVELAPGLADAPVETAWAGLRPATGDRLPYLGRFPELDGVLVAAGHFRNGILLGPLTGRLLADLVLGRAPSVDLAPFSPARPVGRS
ncbi:MAG: glycine oxidase ThiO [Planctomycetes bacterium]|nr:glycine oxidase ThiO [Planctomycetota bacterium]